jgi:glycosyltransferase involved in cell wall biosynthesis
MVKILYVRDNPDKGVHGISKYCDALYRLLSGDSQCQVLPIENYPIVRLPFVKNCYRRKPLSRAMDAADVIHINGYTALSTAQALWMAWRKKKKIVYTAHWHPFEHLTHPLMGRLFFRLLMRFPIRHFAHVVTTINNEDTAFFRSFHHNVVQIPHWFLPSTPYDPACRKDPRMVLFVGRFYGTVKGIEHLYHLPEGKYDIHLVGRGDLRARSDFHPHINISDEELDRLYARASLLVIPSRYEAFSYVALEGLTRNVPVVLSDRVRIADYLSGVQGISIFPFGDYDAFARAVENTIGTPVDMDTVNNTFNPERIKQLYKTVYTQ